MDTATQAKPEPATASEGAAILFFDGVCNLCNRSIDFLIRRDRARRLRYAPLQGRTAAQSLPQELIQSDALPSAVLLEGDSLHTGSDAVLRALTRIGGAWGVLGSLGLLYPRPLRDWVYKLIVDRRYRIWGKRDTCRLPTPEERSLFLD